MLQTLYVKNLALVKEAEINFTNDFNVLTGETGAGKSIIIGSIMCALGGKVSKDIIRTDAEYALCELTFKIDDESKLEELKAMGIEELDEGELLISRKISPTRNSIRINGQTFTVGEVKKVAGMLIDIHGQHEHQLLFDENRHLEILDTFVSEEAQALKETIKGLYDEYRLVCHDMESLMMDESARAREIAFIEYELNEIDEAALRVGEDEELEEDYRRMNNSVRITQELGNVVDMLGGMDNSVSGIAGLSVRSVSNAMQYDSKLEALYNMLMELESLAGDATRQADDYLRSLDFSEEEFNQISSRLTLINNLKAKYNNDISKILEYRQARGQELERLLNIEEEKERLAKKRCELNDRLTLNCDRLTQLRKEAADTLSADIGRVLNELNFLQVCFEIEFTKCQEFSDNGNDRIRFMISTNPGEALKPLKSVASGGEMSRIMLAIKAVLAGTDKVDTLIFDEIDTGISGITAQLVADKIADIAGNHQVICITHLSQIAALADSHFLIEKTAKDDSTYTSIKKLDYDDSINELARILGGNHITEAVLATAREIKK